MKVYVHTFIVRVVTEEKDPAPFAEALSETLCNGGEPALIHSSVDRVPSGQAVISQMPGPNEPLDSWLNEAMRLIEPWP